MFIKNNNTSGYCCAKGKDDLNGDCTTEMQEAILNSQFVNETRHLCVVKLEEDSCSEFFTERDIDYRGYDIEEGIGGDGIPVENGVAECEDLCMAHQPDCAGYSVQIRVRNKNNSD